MNVNDAQCTSLSPDIDRVISQENHCLPANTLTAPFEYLQLLPSNNHRIRGKFLAGFNERFVHVADEKVIAEIGAIIEAFHGASLLIDDIEDDSALRRGSLCAHLKYGMPATLNSGNLMYFVALQRAFSSLPAYVVHDNSVSEAALMAVRNKLLEIYIDEMVNLHVGQGYDIHWRDNYHEVAQTGLPTIEEYLQVAMHKTGGLFRLAVRTLSLFAVDTPEASLQTDLVRLANLLGIIYQIRDDYLNLVDERYARMKGFHGEDIIEGKLSLPILYTLLHEERSSCLHRLYAETASPDERRDDMDKVEEVKRCIADSGALTYSYSLLQEYIEKARQLIGSADDGSSKTLLDLLTGLSQVSQPSVT